MEFGLNASKAIVGRTVCADSWMRARSECPARVDASTPLNLAAKHLKVSRPTRNETRSHQ